MNTIHNAIERRNYLQFDVLVAQRIGLNRPDGKGLTPLMKVCHEPNKRNSSEMVRLLLRQNANTNKLDRRGRTALMHAALTGNADAAKQLIDATYCDFAFRDHEGNAPIHYAAMNGDLPTIALILEEMKKNRTKVDLRNDQGMTPLHVACSQGHVAAARLLYFDGETSLTLRDSLTSRTPRQWLECTCDIPLYMDPFGLNADISLIAPKQAPAIEVKEDSCEIRLFLLMKEVPEINIEEAPSVRPPWDISTNVNAAPKYLKNGRINPERLRRPQSAQNMCTHAGVMRMRPFSAPCGFHEFSSWRTPSDLLPYLSADDMSSLRRYSSITDLQASEKSPLIKAKTLDILSQTCLL